MGNKLSNNKYVKGKNKWNEYKTPKTKHIDFTIFDTKIENINSCSTEHCISIQRLISALKYYQALNIHHQQQNKNIFVKFFKEVYQQIIDDFYHLMHSHNNQLEGIMRDTFVESNKCDITSCEYSSRHYRQNNNNQVCTNTTNHATDPYLKLYVEIMDSLHFFMFHLFHTSFRTTINNQQENQHKNKGNDPYFDANFSTIHQQIRNSQEKTSQFSRISNDSNKFNINKSNNHHASSNNDENEEAGITYIDALFDHLSSINIDNESIEKFRNIINTQQYDTESVAIDIQINDGDGNISHHVQNQKCMGAIIAIFNQSQCMLYNYSCVQDKKICAK